MEKKKKQDYSNIEVSNLDPEKAKLAAERRTELQRLKKQVENAIKKAKDLDRGDMVTKLEHRNQQLATLLKGKTFNDIAAQAGQGSKESNTKDEKNTENSNAAGQEKKGTEKTDNDNSSNSENIDNNIDSENQNSEESTKESNSETEETSNKSNAAETESENEAEGDQDLDKSAGSTAGENNTESKDSDSSSSDSKPTNSDSESTEEKTSNKDSSKDSNDMQQNKPDASNKEMQDNENGNGTSDEDAIKDIFKQPENMRPIDMAQSAMSGGKEGRDPTIDEIVGMLSGISADGKDGVIKALKDILSKRGVPGFYESLGKNILKEAIEDKALEDIGDEEFADFVNTVLDEINNITPITYSDPDERKIKVKQDMENSLETRDIDMEQEMQVRADKRRKRANQSELNKYTNYRPISEFYVDLYRTIADQVKQVEINSQSYDEINPEYDDDVIMKADVTTYEQRQEKPSIDFFFDVSGSWGDSDVELGKHFVASLKEFVDRDELELNIYYFSDIVDQDLDTARTRSGTTAWLKILNTIKNNNAKNVVIMTDGDMDVFAAAAGQKCFVEGVVWYIWKIGGYYATGGKELPKYLKGMEGTSQYSFTVRDSD